MDNGTIDLKKLRKNLPPPPVVVSPLNTGFPQPPLPPPPAAVVTPPPAPSGNAMALPPKPRRGWLWLPKFDIPRLSWKKAVIAVVAVIVFLAIGHYIYADFWTKSPFGPTGGTSQADSAAAAATSTSGTSESDIIAAVGKIMLLPADETPTLAKVSDLSVLQSQEFFKNAAVGDIVLMYAKSLRAILYDPVQNKIIEVGPITAASSSNATSTSQ